MEAATLIKGMNAENPDFLLGYHTKLLDGNCIEASEHRIEVLRTTKSVSYTHLDVYKRQVSGRRDEKITLAGDFFCWVH